MRKIKFRGLRTDGKGWVYGFPYSSVYDEDIDQIVESDCHHDIKPETVGQFTGLHDKNGKEIYEDDKFTDEDDGSYYLIEWDNDLTKFAVNFYSYSMFTNEGSGEEYDNEISKVDKNVIDVMDLQNDCIIGNIHENPGTT